MSEHAVNEPHGHGTEQHGHGAAEHSHPGPGQYIKIGVILFILTVVEVAIVYIPSLKALLIPILMVLMTVKFAMVVMWFMHLKFDHRLFSSLFVFPLIIAVCITLALMALFGSFWVGGGEAVAGGCGH